MPSATPPPAGKFPGDGPAPAPAGSSRSGGGADAALTVPGSPAAVPAALSVVGAAAACACVACAGASAAAAAQAPSALTRSSGCTGRLEANSGALLETFAHSGVEKSSGLANQPLSPANIESAVLPQPASIVADARAAAQHSIVRYGRKIITPIIAIRLPVMRDFAS